MSMAGSRSTFVLEEILAFLSHRDLTLYIATMKLWMLQNHLFKRRTRKKSIEDIESMHEHNLQAFTALCNMQIQLLYQQAQFN